MGLLELICTFLLFSNGLCGSGNPPSAPPGSETQIESILQLKPFQLTSESTDKLKFEMDIFDSTKATSEETAKDAFIGNYFGMLPISGNNSITLTKARLPRSIWYKEDNTEREESEINTNLLKYNFEFSALKYEYGYNCSFQVSPSSPVNAPKVDSKKTVSFSSPGKIICNKMKFKIKGNITIKPRGFEFYNTITFEIKVRSNKTGSKELAESFVSYKTDMPDSQIDDEGYGPKVPFTFNNDLPFGTGISIEAVCTTSDYYACKIDKSSGDLNDNLEIGIKCHPRSKKYDKLYITAWILVIIFIVVLVASIGNHYRKNMGGRKH